MMLSKVNNSTQVFSQIIDCIIQGMPSCTVRVSQRILKEANPTVSDPTNRVLSQLTIQPYHVSCQQDTDYPMHTYRGTIGQASASPSHVALESK